MGGGADRSDSAAVTPTAPPDLDVQRRLELRHTEAAERFGATSIAICVDAATSRRTISYYRGTRRIPSPDSPDCAAGKHHGCTGDSWDADADLATPCGCACHVDPD